MGSSNWIPNQSRATAAPQLPAVGQSPAMYGEYEFECGPAAPDRPGVFVLTRSVEGRAKPIFVGEGDSIINAIENVRAKDAALDVNAQGFAWMPLPFAGERSAMVRRFIELFAPEFNVSKAVPAVRPPQALISMPAVKLPALLETADLATTLAARKAMMESEIAQLVARY